MKIALCILFLTFTQFLQAQDEEVYVIRAFHENGKKLGTYTVTYLDSSHDTVSTQSHIYRVVSKLNKVYICRETIHCAGCFGSITYDFSWHDTEGNFLYKASQKTSEELKEILYKANPKKDTKILAMFSITHYSQKIFYALLMNSKEENTDDGYINKHEYWLLGETGKILQKFTLTAYSEYEILMIIPNLFEKR